MLDWHEKMSFEGRSEKRRNDFDCPLWPAAHPLRSRAAFCPLVRRECYLHHHHHYQHLTTIGTFLRQTIDQHRRTQALRAFHIPRPLCLRNQPPHLQRRRRRYTPKSSVMTHPKRTLNCRSLYRHHHIYRNHLHQTSHLRKMHQKSRRFPKFVFLVSTSPRPPETITAQILQVAKGKTQRWCSRPTVPAAARAQIRAEAAFQILPMRSQMFRHRCRTVEKRAKPPEGA